jgi:hypothetical protein
VINLLDFEFIIIYFLEDVLTTGYRTRTTKTLNNCLDIDVPKELKAHSKKEKALHRKQRETKEGNHGQQPSALVHLYSKNQTSL